MILQTTGNFSQDTRAQFQTCEPVLWVLNHYNTQKSPHALRWTTAWICLVQDLTIQTSRADNICCIQLFALFLHQQGHRATSAPHSRVVCHAGTQKPWSALKWSSSVREKQFIFLMFVLLFPFFLIFFDLLKIDKPVIISCWKVPFHNTECHKNMVNSASGNSTTCTKIIQFQCRDSYLDNYSEVSSRDRSESNTFTWVKINPE